MASQVDGPCRAFVAGEDLAIFRCVKPDANVAAVYADDGDQPLGVTQEAVSDTERVAVRFLNCVATVKVTAAGVFAARTYLYAADDGKVDDSGAGDPIGISLQAATAAGDVIEMAPCREAVAGFTPTGVV